MDDEQELDPRVYTCTAARLNGICGFTTTDPLAHCPHDMVVVSTGKRYIAPEQVRTCPTCGQPLGQIGQKAVGQRAPGAAGPEIDRVPDQKVESARRGVASVATATTPPPPDPSDSRGESSLPEAIESKDPNAE